MIGVMNEDSRPHAPNENIFLEDYTNGIKMIAAVMKEFAV
jgi:acetylornithine deacetylase/succinyl-diaminopimelate desuccinylase-like protein